KGEDEDLHDEVYEKRHRKQEMLERRIKNREKEKLRHAMYQQQQVVEKLRHMDINRLMPLSAFRTQHKKTASEEPSRSSVPIMQEEYHRRLIREAEESLRRFEQLGLAGEASTTRSSPSTKTSPAPSSRKSQSSKTSITPAQPPRPPKPITTFIKPGTVLASGGRKSSRVVLAFGEKVPTLDRMDFDLPLD
ncbi:MAG: hypothetical protein BYD32DRAFT_361988, partial [Podila humilis]